LRNAIPCLGGLILAVLMTNLELDYCQPRKVRQVCKV
jgi:hypothetical protein